MELTDAEKETMRKECARLMQWAFTQIRFFCGYGTGLTAGEEAWIWTVAEFAHNLPHLVEYDFSRPRFYGLSSACTTVPVFENTFNNLQSS